MKKHLYLLNSLQNSLPKIHFAMDECYDKLEEVITNAHKTLDEMRTRVVEVGFSSEQEEILFFKTVKPRVISILVFHLELLRLKGVMTVEPEKSQKKILNEQINKLTRYLKENKEFYEYWVRHKTHLDDLYFHTKSFEEPRFWSHDMIPLALDPKFHTSHDLILGKILGITETINFLKEYLRSSKMKSNPISALPFKWTASKADLVELIYALHLSGAINSGKGKITDITVVFQQMFQIEIRDIYRTFLEIRGRKNTLTKFIERIKQKLITKIQDFEE